MTNVIYACDIGGSKLLCGLVTPDGRILDTEKRPLSPNVTVEELEQYLTEHFRLLTARHPEVTPTACGMTIPGLADPQTGTWVYACFSGIENYPIALRMSQKLGMHVAVENDVNACAWAEKIFGGCMDCGNYLWVTVSNGVGGGLVLNGQLYSGAFGGAGEIGHIVVEPDGALCPCGHRGCLEAMAAGPAISRRYQDATAETLTAAEIADRARQGEAAALAVLQKTGEYIGRGLGKTASLLNLERYILGGGVMQSLDLLEPAIRTAFEREAFARPNQKAVIAKTALAYEAGLLGAAAITLK